MGVKIRVYVGDAVCVHGDGGEEERSLKKKAKRRGSLRRNCAAARVDSFFGAPFFCVCAAKEVVSFLLPLARVFFWGAMVFEYAFKLSYRLLISTGCV